MKTCACNSHGLIPRLLLVIAVPWERAPAAVKLPGFLKSFPVILPWLVGFAVAKDDLSATYVAQRHTHSRFARGT